MSKKVRANGEGSIYRRSSDNRWVGAVSVPGIGRKTFYGSTRREAAEKVRVALNAAAIGAPVAPRNVTVGRVLADWLAAIRPTVRSSTYVAYEVRVRLHLAPLASVPVLRLTPTMIRDLQDSLLAAGLAPRSVSHTNKVLRMALGQAVNEGTLGRNVALMVEPPRVGTAPMNVLTGPELALLIATTNDPVRRAIWSVCGGLGLRLGEALGLQWDDINGDVLSINRALRPMPGQKRGERQQLVELKTPQSHRSLVAPHFVSRAIAELSRRSDFVFSTSKGTPMDQRNLLRLFKRDLASAGLPPMRIHDLRHTAATLLLSGGIDLATVGHTLGHASITTTAGYAHVLPSMKQSAADRMDDLVATRLLSLETPRAISEHELAS